MRKIFILLAFTLAASACSDWLDVPPPTSVNDRELFETEDGFMEALNGVYISAANYNLYGGVFTIEMLDAMMQNYSYSVSDPTDYAETAAFDFGHGMTRARFNMVWSRAYTTITNCNLILENIAAQREAGLFSPGIGEIVEAEALAMRAYIHFDMLRLCAPVSGNGGNDRGRLAIPYVTEYTNKLTPISNSGQVIAAVLADLDAAKALLAGVDPILDPAYVVNYNTTTQIVGGVTVVPEQNVTIGGEPLPMFLQNRRHHMNYYAVCGALARVHMWNATALGEAASFEQAARNANEVIASKKFKWTSSKEVSGDKDKNTFDREMYKELIFALYMENDSQITALNDRFDNTTTGYYVTQTTLSAIYESNTIGSEDLRLRAWFEMENTSSNSKIIKYLRNGDDEGNLHYLVSPQMRLGEMYYIVAECLFNQPSIGGLEFADPWQALQFVRDQREVKTPLDPATQNFTAELLKEYRKDTFCEGQAFLNYKRLFQTITRVDPMTIYDPTSVGTGHSRGIYYPMVSNSAYEWLPQSEMDNRIQ